MKLHDQHVHSMYSADSNELLKNYLEKATIEGCKYFLTTEHFDLDLVEFHDNWIGDYDKVEEELNILKKDYPNIEMLLGIEAGYKDDRIDEILEKLNSKDFDVINLSIHDGPNLDFYWYKYFEKFGEDKTMKLYFNIMIKATSTFTKYNVLSHIDYGFKTIYQNDNTKKIQEYEPYIIEVFKNLIKNNKAFEINTKVQEAINDDNHTVYLLKLYKSLGGEKLTLSSDAHSSERYRSSFDYYMKLIKECGFEYLVYFIKQTEHKYYL